MGTVAEVEDDFSILEATAMAHLGEDVQPLLQDQSVYEEEDGLQNASYFALKKAFAALKVRLREVEHENERLHRQVKQLESSSGEFGSGSGPPRPELMPSINKAYEAYKEKCHESAQLKERLSQATQKWHTAETQLQQLREQLSRGCTKCAAQQTVGGCSRSSEGQTAQCCSNGTTQRTAQGCSRAAEGGTVQDCPNGLDEQLTQEQTAKLHKYPDPVLPPSGSVSSAPASMASAVQEELAHTRAEMAQLRALVRSQHRALSTLLSAQEGRVKSPESMPGARDGPPSAGTSDIGSLGVSDPGSWGTRGPPDIGDPTIGGHGVHPVQCADEVARQNIPTNNGRNGDADDLMLFSASNVPGRQTNQFGRTLDSTAVNTGRQTNQFGRTVDSPAANSRQTNQFGRTLESTSAHTRSIARPRYPPADGYHQLGLAVGVPLPTGRPQRRPGAPLENRFRQLGANQCVQTPIQYERNTEAVGRHDNVGGNVNITQPEAAATNKSPTTPTQARQFAWLESGKEIPPQNIYAAPGGLEPHVNHTHGSSNDPNTEVGGHSGEWGGQNDVVVQGSPLEWDRECPMCQQVFPDDIPQEMFVQHVNSHFEEEEARHDGFELFQM